MKEMPQPCPRTVELSAFIDNELAGTARDALATHAASCPLCGAMLEELERLRVKLQPLAHARAGIDLAPLVEERLRRPGEPARPRLRPPRVRAGWQLLPAGIAAAGALAMGINLGMVLGGGAVVTASRPASMALFDAVPPGGLCVGLSSCYSLGK